MSLYTLLYVTGVDNKAGLAETFPFVAPDTSDLTVAINEAYCGKYRMLPSVTVTYIKVCRKYKCLCIIPRQT